MQKQKNSMTPPTVEGAGKKSGKGHSGYDPRTYRECGVDYNAAPKYVRPGKGKGGRGGNPPERGYE